MTSAIELKSPDGTNKVRLEHHDNVSKTINIVNLKEESDIQTMIKNRAGSAGAFSFRNKIIDGRFDFWYEGTSQTTSGYGSSTMWLSINVGSTKTFSRQAFSLNELPEVPAAKYYSRTVVTSVAGVNNYTRLQHRIEDVETLAGKTVTLSFYAKADASRKIGVDILQYISPTLNQISEAEIFQLSTEWQRYAYTVTLPLLPEEPSASANSLQPNFWFEVGSTFAAERSSTLATLGQQSGTFDIACVQLEEGSVATPFEELPMPIASIRLSRYYLASTLLFQGDIRTAGTFGATWLSFPVPLRTTPTITLTHNGGVGFDGTGLLYTDVNTYGVLIRETAISVSGAAYWRAKYVIDCRI